jgi:XTP/dITP diphosphohydrolase
MQEILIGDGPLLNERVQWRLLSDFPNWPEPLENGATFADNAAIKAHYYARLSGIWTLADDSGLEVDALRGEPGVRSARFAGEPKSDQANNALLLEKLAEVPDIERTARFRCAVVLSDGKEALTRAQGTVEGRILREPRGSNGFGYDPLFLVLKENRAAAEMNSDEKHAVSHRGQALRRLRDQLIPLLDQE